MLVSVPRTKDSKGTVTYPGVGVVAEPGGPKAAGRSGGLRAGPLGTESAAEEWDRKG